MTIPNCQEFRAWHIIDIHKPPWYVLERNFQHVSLTGWDALWPPPSKAPDARRGEPPTWMTGGGASPKYTLHRYVDVDGDFDFQDGKWLVWKIWKQSKDNGCLSPSNSKIVDDVEIEISHQNMEIQATIVHLLVFQLPCIRVSMRRFIHHLAWTTSHLSFRSVCLSMPYTSPS